MVFYKEQFELLFGKTLWVYDNKSKDILIENSPTVQHDIVNDYNNWQKLEESIKLCNRCVLCKSRQNVVIERGNRTAKWLFVGEAPGAEEDKEGKPFVGKAGQLLDKMILSMNLDQNKDVYICNVIKCRPPNNRNPDNEEINNCKNYLYNQINMVSPTIIIALGRFATQALLEDNLFSINKLRLKKNFYKNIPVVVTYHPAYLLRNVNAKKDAWQDLKFALSIFEKL